MISIDRYYLCDLLNNILILTIRDYQNIKTEICGGGKWNFMTIYYFTGGKRKCQLWRKKVTAGIIAIADKFYSSQYYLFFV